MRVQLVDHFGGNLNVASDLNNLRLVSLQTKPDILTKAISGKFIPGYCQRNCEFDLNSLTEC